MPRGVYERKPKTTTEDTVAEDEKTEKTAPDTEQGSAAGEICDQCWPGGWPEDTAAATCLHGAWTQ